MAATQVQSGFQRLRSTQSYYPLYATCYRVAPPSLKHRLSKCGEFIINIVGNLVPLFFDSRIKYYNHQNFLDFVLLSSFTISITFKDFINAQ